MSEPAKAYKKRFFSAVGTVLVVLCCFTPLLVEVLGLLGLGLVIPYMELSLAIAYGIPVAELASRFHPYLTLSEAVKLAALTFDKDIAQLSCCAS